MPSGDKTGIATGQTITADQITKIIDSVEDYVFKHIKITGTAGSPNTIKIIPGAVGLKKITVDGVEQSIYCYGFNGEKEVPAFEEASDYNSLKYDIQIKSEQEQTIKMDYGSGNYPQVNASGELIMKLYKSGIGAGYNGSADCYCTLKIGRN